jgi:hypothetical protein
MKDKFYKESFINNYEKILDRKDIEINIKYQLKKLNLSIYDKRKFIDDKRDTVPLYRVDEYTYK